MRTLQKILGLSYLVNLSTKEIHLLKQVHKNCHVERIRRKVYVPPVVAYILIYWFGYNGCWWCFREKDTDK
jgi:hypothetical protein